MDISQGSLDYYPFWVDQTMQKYIDFEEIQYIFFQNDPNDQYFERFDPSNGAGQPPKKEVSWVLVIYIHPGSRCHHMKTET